ncbi:unnamed protein product, partial [Didymodactylos carnosus]
MKQHDNLLLLIDMFSGNPANYCDYIFTKIDKDKNGKIDFREFMSAVAVTSKGNAENVGKRLDLIFHIINNKDKDGINAQELVKFIEVITELEKGEDAVSTNDAKSIIKQMFKLCGTNEDEGMLSKEEFMNCCTKNSQICHAFLPDFIENSTKLTEKTERLVSLGASDLRLIHNFLTDYYNSVTWQLTLSQNIQRILKPKLETFFKGNKSHCLKFSSFFCYS